MQAGDFPNHDTPMGLGKKVAVIGSGNTAMDAMRVSLRLGAEKVYCIYRRTIEESPARNEEIEHAEEEGVEFHWLSTPVEILDDGDGNVRGMRCIKMELGEPDDSGRRRPVPVEGSDYEFEADTIVYAIGTSANPIIGQTSKIKLNKWGFIETDEHMATSLTGVYAGGDIVTGGATVILAMGAGRKAAGSMKKYLNIRDSESVYRDRQSEADGFLFGIEQNEKNFVRLRAI
jgi:glutamate synthase (NADPH/NADH) small chain